jgi:DNA-binding transcriptional ArsR family regulator
MPRLTVSQPKTGPEIEFIVSVPIDMLNAMYFTHLVEASEGVEGFPLQVRREMAPDLLAELDFLYSYPKGQPGVMGWFGDTLWAHPETWESVDAVIKYLREMPLGVGPSISESGIQGLAFYATCDPFDVQSRPDPGSDPRNVLRRVLEEAEANVEELLAIYDDPESLRKRMINLIERFYEEHYKDEISNRLPILERSIAEHRSHPVSDVVELGRTLSQRTLTCFETVCGDDFKKYFFAPSLDVAPYCSCANIDGIHGLVYPCEARFIHDAPDADETARMARVYKALSDETRLRIINLVREREMYAQEIVDRIGLHQSVVSRHLGFLKAVGILRIRKENSMKFYSINTEMRDELSRMLDLFAPMVSASH